ncbi:Trans-aconitate 2-methyltransferase [Pseudovibrio sp. W64]|uniref:class I SAM-dependent methyltransferase n=1 Tax=unclassified Pseudovibrio TaxID=2627060 RepID=UPI0007AE3976|nr:MULTISPECIES: class I SAM-dependent methyltransferase [unclassified Pseudovibrio]KZK78257.1 Trans-aconitate 2-methyltransferase [Pseudovibrio sp. W64]KZK84646.1 Trans-aconitate 2-methyltransferase [Pseudovibrio sp. Ad13]
MNEKVAHWNAVYDAREEEYLTWYETQPTLSYQLVTQHLKLGETFIDVGGGASKLISILHAAGYGPLAVLDISSVVLDAGKERLGGVADDVEWINADITTWTPEKTYQVWHDRAVFHFLTEIEDQKAYINALVKAVPVGGTAIISSFSEDGPEKCSGLPVQRYSSRTLAAKLQALAPGVFALTDAQTHTHITPKKNQQNFQTSVFERVA